MKNVIFASILFAIILSSCKLGNGNSSDSSSKEDTVKVLTAKDVYNKNKDKVAMIISYKEGIPYAQGSGFFIDKNTLVTNFHCVAGSDAIELKFAGEEKIYKGASVIKASDEYDLAIIRTTQDFHFVKIDSLEKEDVGSKVYAIGNPRGLEGTISEGILSGKRDNEGVEFLQITAPISPGNSGGPILNEKGEVIGVATFTVRNSQNLNFAMPIKYISKCKDIANVQPSKSLKIGTNSNAVSMTNFVKDESSYEAYFSIKNNTNQTLTNIYYVIIYRSKSGEILHYYDKTESFKIAPHLAKRVQAYSFGDWYDYSCNGETFSFNDRHPKFKVEFRLISYEIVE